MSTYFITGATGVLGSAIVRELLMYSSHRLVLLIRAQDDAVLQARVEQLMAFLEVDSDIAKLRIEPIRGNTELKEFGLDSADYAKLGASVTHIIHSAAIVRMNLPLDMARRAAVAAAENAMQTCPLMSVKRDSSESGNSQYGRSGWPLEGSASREMDK